MSTTFLFYLLQVLGYVKKSFTFTVDRHDFLCPEYIVHLKVEGASDSQIYYRDVKVPAEDIKKCKNMIDVLEKVFYWGQNDFQPVEYSPSVSVKDVIIVMNKRFKVDSIGFTELS